MLLISHMIHYKVVILTKYSIEYFVGSLQESRKVSHDACIVVMSCISSPFIIHLRVKSCLESPP